MGTNTASSKANQLRLASTTWVTGLPSSNS